MRRARKLQIIGRVFLVVGIIAAIIGGGFLGYMQAQLNKAHGDIDTNDIKIDESIPLLFDEDIVNILLLGVDERPSEGDVGRSDTTMIATIDFKNNQLKLTSLMRDMYVNIPGYGYGKFNQAYANGGIELVIQTIASNFGIKLDGYATVNFYAFVDIIDILGGVEIDINQDEYEWIQANCKSKTLLAIKPGLQNLNGYQALLYSRLRFVGNNDFERTDRQRRVLSTLFDKLKTQSYGAMVRVMTSALNHVKTDLSMGEIQSLAYNVLQMNVDEIDQLRVPMDGTYTFDWATMNGVNVSVIKIDVEANREAINRFIYSQVLETQADGSSNGATETLNDYEDYENYEE